MCVSSVALQDSNCTVKLDLVGVCPDDGMKFFSSSAHWFCMSCYQPKLWESAWVLDVQSSSSTFIRFILTVRALRGVVSWTNRKDRYMVVYPLHISDTNIVSVLRHKTRIFFTYTETFSLFSMVRYSLCFSDTDSICFLMHRTRTFFLKMSHPVSVLKHRYL